MRTDIAFDKLVQIVPIISELRPKLKEDEKLKSFLERYKSKEDVDNIDFVMSIVPFLFGEYKEYTYQILSILGDKTVDEVKAQPFGETLSQLKEIISNGDLTSFF